MILKLGIRAHGDFDVQCPMDELCKNTVDQIFEDQDLAEKVIELRDENGGTLKLKYFFKYGSDGSQGHPIFKQIISGERYQGAW